MSRVPGSPADPRDLTIAYDQLGNITQKAGIAYGYKNAPGETGCSATAGPHALSRYQNQFYCFDANGNNTQVRQAGQVIRSITYTGDDLPERIVRNEGTIQADATFRYGPDRARYKRIDNAAATSAGTCGGGADSIFCSGFEDGGLTTGSSTTYYLGNVEIIQQGTSAQIKRYVGDYLVVTRTESTSGSVLATAHDYLLRDHLGSIEVIVNGQGQVQQRLSFDAYGNRRVADPAGAWNLSRVLDAFAAASFDTSRTRRGFTGHEQLDALGLIHMNGRLYDPQIGRFIQADPLAEPDATQGLNRYSYVLNNPLSATDPTGYLSFRQVLGLAVGVGFSIWSGGLLAHSVIGSFFAATGGGFLSAVIATGSTKAGGWGALSAAMFWGIGQGFAGVAAANVRNGVATLRSGLTTGQTAAKIAAHAGAGGVLAELQGGSFGHGFIAAGVTQALNPAVAQIEGKGFTAITARTVVSATIGGTVSEITGGSFANGAATGAFQQLFNDSVHGLRLHQQQEQLADMLQEQLGAMTADLDAQIEFHALNQRILGGAQKAVFDYLASHDVAGYGFLRDIPGGISNPMFEVHYAQNSSPYAPYARGAWSGVFSGGGIFITPHGTRNAWNAIYNITHEVLHFSPAFSSSWMEEINTVEFNPIKNPVHSQMSQFDVPAATSIYRSIHGH